MAAFCQTVGCSASNRGTQTPSRLRRKDGALILQVDKIRVAFQGEAGAFSEAAAVQLYGDTIVTVPRPTFDATFRAITDGHADALLVPVENSLAGSVVRVYDLLLESELTITAETILPIEMNLIGCPGASLSEIRSVSSHPMALAQCERFFGEHPSIRRLPAEDTAGSVREMLVRGDKTHAAIAGKYAADRYRGEIIAERIQDNAENFTRFVFLQPVKQAASGNRPEARKMSIAMRLAHRPGSLLSSLEPFSRNGVNLLKIESRPIHGRPWEYQFFIDVEADAVSQLERALRELREAAHEVRVLGLYPAARNRT
jgi:prephenate dehydratase